MSQPLAWLALPLAALLAASGDAGQAPPDDGVSGPALGVLRKALEAGAAQADAAAQRRAYRQAVTAVLPLVKKNVMVTESLQAAAAEADRAAGDAAAAKVLRGALAEARETLSFQPKMEAKLPEGFPRPTPVGEVRVQQYPAYRLARTAMAGDTFRPFMTLFNHIQKNDIAMTAPVEMTYSGKGKEKRSMMAFLYGSRQVGKTGKDGPVEVVDVPAALAVSIGERGELTEARLAAARQRLEAWLKAHAAEYAAAGSLRVMGYNSPAVPRDRRYSEVQIPVRKLGKPGG